jgi:hypothetical protein
MALKETGGKKQEENGQGRNDGALAWFMRSNGAKSHASRKNGSKLKKPANCGLFGTGV